MESKQSNSDLFDENQSIQVIREMIQVSRNKLKNDGILFIVWGWNMVINNLITYLFRTTAMTFEVSKILGNLHYVLFLLVLLFTVFYVVRQHKKVQTYIGISLRYVWISLIVCMVLINLIEFNVLHKIDFEFQHPLYMVIVAFAIVISGGILRYKLIISGGIAFGILAYLCSFLSLQNQMLVEATAWLIAFTIPGHLLYLKRKS